MTGLSRSLSCPAPAKPGEEAAAVAGYSRSWIYELQGLLKLDFGGFWANQRGLVANVGLLEALEGLAEAVAVGN